MKNWIPTLVLGSALALSGHAVAEQAGSTTQGNSQAQGAVSKQQGAQNVKTDFEKSELRTFVDIQKGIGEVRNEYAKKIQEAESQEKAQELQNEARDSLIEVVEGADLSVEKYNQIAQAYQVSPEVRQKVNQMVQQ
jgi:uncharacterized coiled-coil DUF342 family protein